MQITKMWVKPKKLPPYWIRASMSISRCTLCRPTVSVRVSRVRDRVSRSS